MDHNSLINLTARLSSSLKTDFDMIKFYTQELQRNLGDKHLNWNIAHMQASVIALITDLERHQQYLQKDMDAS